MKTTKHKSLPLMMLLVCICSIFVFGTSTLAATKTIKGTPESFILYKNKSMNTFLYCLPSDSSYNFTELYKANPKPVHIKSSNTAVMDAQLGKVDNHYYVKVTAKKEGTAKITYEFSYRKNTYKVVETFKIHKYKVPFSVFTIGNTDFKPRFATTGALVAKRNHTGILTIKPAAGWRIDTMMQSRGNKTISIKNKQRISINEKYDTSIVFYNVKEQYYQCLFITRING